MNRWVGFRVSAGLALLVFLCAAGAAAAQDGSTGLPSEDELRPAAVLGLVRPRNGADDGLQEVLTSSIAVKLARRGLQAITEPSAVSASAEIGSETLFTLARRVEADYVLEGVYSSSRDEIEIQLVWYNATTRQAAVTVSERGHLGLNMDRLLSDALGEIFAQVDGELARYSRAPAYGIPGSAILESSQGEQASGVPVSLPGRPIPTVPDPRPGSAPLRPDLEPGESLDPGQPPVAQGKPRRKHVELSTAGSAFIATGAASEYFKLGYGSSLHFDLLFPAGPGSIGAGLYAAVNYFEATGVATSAQSLLIPVGVDIRYTLIDVLPLGLFVHASGGPAMLLLRSDYWGEMDKVVPYALAGLGMNVRLGPSLGTALDLSYSVYFEGSLVIMAFSPSVSLYFRF